MEERKRGLTKRDLTKLQRFAKKHLRSIDKDRMAELEERALLQINRATFRNPMGWPFVLIPAAAIIVGSDVHSLFTLVLILVFAICHIRMIWIVRPETLILLNHKQPLRNLIYMLVVIYFFLGLPALMELICVGYIVIQSIQSTQTTSIFDLDDVLWLFIQSDCPL